MRAFLLLSTAAIAMAISSQAMAQAGGGARGGSGASPAAPARPPAPPPRRTPAPAPAPATTGADAVSVMRYLNGGDFVAGSAINSMSDEARRRLTMDLNGVQDAANAAGHYRYTDFLDGHMFLPILGIEAGDPRAEEAYGAASANAGRVANHTLQSPSAGAGTRPTSNLEDAQTRALRQVATALDQRLAAANQLVQAARETNNSDYLNRASTLAVEAQNARRDVGTALALSEAYRGRAFTSDLDAQAYLRLRGESLGEMSSASANLSNGLGLSFPERANTLFAEMRAGFDGVDTRLGGNADPISNATRQRYEDALNQSRIADHRVGGEVNRATPQMGGYGTTPADLARVRREFGDNRVVTPLSPAAGPGRSRADIQRDFEATAAAIAAQQRTRNEAAYRPGMPPAAGGHAAEVAGGSEHGQNEQAAEDNRPPEPVPTRPDYPTASAEDRARISREARKRREAQERSASQTAAAERARQDMAAREAAERAAMVERSRIADENHRLFDNARRLAAQDNRWAQLVRSRFGNGAWDAFANDNTVTVLQLLDIYRNYDPNQAIPPARSLSSAGNSPSSAGNSLSLAGLDYRDPAVESLNDVLYQLTTRLRRSPFDMVDRGDPARAAQMAYNAGSFDVRYNRTGSEHLESGGYLAASLLSQEDSYLRQLTANGLTGLDALLAQPFNVILTWGAGSYDLDLHMTGPLSDGAAERFHIYYATAGNLDAQPFAALIKDCVCNAGSEVILTSALNRGGVYRVSAFNFGDQSATSSNLSNMSDARIQIVRGGTTQSVGNGTTIVGGRTILDTSVPNGGLGNTWTAIELDPKNGRITVPRTITQSAGSRGVN